MININSFRWYKKIFHFLTDLCLHNAWILFKVDHPDQVHDRKLTYYSFKGEVCHSLMNKPASTSNNCASMQDDVDPPAHNVVDEEIRLDGVNHIPRYQKGTCVRRCRVQCGSRTSFYCSKCRVYLCFKRDKNCFDAWHSNYRRGRRSSN